MKGTEIFQKYFVSGDLYAVGARAKISKNDGKVLKSNYDRTDLLDSAFAGETNEISGALYRFMTALYETIKVQQGDENLSDDILEAVTDMTAEQFMPTAWEDMDWSKEETWAKWNRFEDASRTSYSNEELDFVRKFDKSGMTVQEIRHEYFKRMPEGMRRQFFGKPGTISIHRPSDEEVLKMCPGMPELLVDSGTRA